MNTNRLSHILFQLRRERLPRGNREELEAEITRTFEGLRARITDLEAQLAALRTPYMLIVDEDHSWGFSDWFWEVRYGTNSLWRMGGYEFEYEARAVGKAFFDKLTAPFGAKGE